MTVPVGIVTILNDPGGPISQARECDNADHFPVCLRTKPNKIIP